MFVLRIDSQPMPNGYAHDAPYTRALAWREDADNGDLVAMTVRAARIGARSLQWPAALNRADAARIAHAYAQDVVEYVREDGDQLIRLPWRTVADGQGDCKSLAVLVASLCAAAGRRVVLRFVAFPGEDWYGHVYAVVDGVPNDPELDFGEECVYSHRIDRRIA